MCTHTALRAALNPCHFSGPIGLFAWLGNCKSHPRHESYLVTAQTIMRPYQFRSRRRGVTLIEVMVASMIGVLVTTTTFASVIYYQMTSARNDRVAEVAQLLDGQLETLRNQTWASLSDGNSGLFPPGGPGVGTWPASNATSLTRREATTLRRTFIADPTSVDPDYCGLAGTLRVFYTPFRRRHVATSVGGTSVAYDVEYYKVEVTMTLDQTNRIRPGTGPDEWSVITYLSELGGRSEGEFQQRVLDSLRARAIPLT